MSECFAVVGNPIAHSLSPIIHQQFAQQTGKTIQYEKIQLAPEALADFVVNFFKQGGKGLNVTLPFKEAAYAMAVVRTPRCEQAKAANTLWMQNGVLTADNTDGVGLLRDLKHWTMLSGQRILLLGAGGAARGIIGPLLSSGIAELIVTNRTMAKAEALQQEFPSITCCEPTQLQDNYDIVINATAASTLDAAIIWPKHILHSAKLAYDLAYKRPGDTPFVQWAKAANIQAVDGLGMLVEQAAEAFYQWHGVFPDTTAVL